MNERKTFWKGAFYSVMSPCETSLSCSVFIIVYVPFCCIALFCLAFHVSPWLSTLIHYSPYLTSKATVIVLLYTYTVYTWHSHSCVWFAQNRNTEAVLIFYIARKKSIAHKGQHQSRETHFWWDAIGSFEASVETNVYADILAKYYRLHSWVYSLYKSKIYSKDFTGYANNPPNGCRTEQTGGHVCPPHDIICW